MSESHPEFLALCQAIGYIVVNWALVERQIDQWASVAYKQCNGRALRKNQDIPRQFTQKKQFLVECFKKLQPLAPYRTRACDLLTEAIRLSKIRNDLVHGTIDSIDAPDGVFHFQILSAERTHHTLREFDFDLKSFPEIEASLLHLQGETLLLSNDLADRFLRPHR